MAHYRHRSHSLKLRRIQKRPAADPLLLHSCRHWKREHSYHLYPMQPVLEFRQRTKRAVLYAHHLFDHPSENHPQAATLWPHQQYRPDQPGRLLRIRQQRLRHHRHTTLFPIHRRSSLRGTRYQFPDFPVMLETFWSHHRYAHAHVSRCLLCFLFWQCLEKTRADL